ncbi:MAG: hypothetical protein ACFFF4_03635 [Candidatus Thorarchaeota archaeon]
MKIIKISLPILLMLVLLPSVALAGLDLNTSLTEDTLTGDFHTAQIMSWHEDCSSTDGWTYYTDWTGWTRWDTASGTLDSTEGYLHCPSNTGWTTGPFWFKELDSIFTLADFESVEIEVETNQPSQSYKGNLFFTVFDTEGNPIFYIGVYSWDELEHRVHIYTGFYHDDMSSDSYFVQDMAPDFYGTIEIYYDSSDGLMATIPGGGSGQILSPTEWSSEQSRAAKYVGLQWRKGSGIYLDHRVHDMLLNAGGVSTSTTSTSTTSLTDGSLPSSLDFTGLFGMGISVGAIAVIIIVGGGIYCRQRGAAPVSSEFTYG